MGSSEDGSHHTDGSDIDEKKGKNKSALSLFSSNSIVYRCSIPLYLNDPDLKSSKQRDLVYLNANLFSLEIENEIAQFERFDETIMIHD
jgi:hypothetical protein